MRPAFLGVLCAVACFVSTCGAQQTPDAQHGNGLAPNLALNAAPQPVTIPDGTQIQLRLAQSVRGMTRSIKGTRVYSKPGDKVRLVAADDVRVTGSIVISKGAAGQATVTKVDFPTETYSYTDRYATLAELFVPKTGSVSLQLDWIEDITGHQVPLRAYQAGESKPFIMVVLSEEGGIVARPAKLSQDLKPKTWPHVKQWAPAGTRIFGFVHGAVNIDPAELKDAQALLPIPNPTAMLTIFRTKGHRELQPRLFCDDKEVAPVGQRQYTTLEFVPGKHLCHADGQPSVELAAEAGEEYFLRVQYHTFAGTWELNSVTTAQGEDSVANLELAEKPSEKQSSASVAKGR